jgi:hypothetical protein
MAATVAIIYLAIIIFWVALTLNKYRFVARTTYCIYHLGETATYLKCIILITGKRNRWEICLSMREQNEPRNCVEYTQRVFTKRHNRVNIAKCLYKINDCFMLKMDMI